MLTECVSQSETQGYPGFLLARENPLFTESLIRCPEPSPGVAITHFGLTQVDEFPSLVKCFGEGLELRISSEAVRMTQHTRILAPNPASKALVRINSLAFPWRRATADHLTNEVQQAVSLVNDYRRVMGREKDWSKCL